MSNSDYKKYVFGALAFLGLSTAAYYFYYKIFSRSINKENTDIKNNKITKEIANNKEIEMQKKDSTFETEIDNLVRFSECLKSIINNSFEQLFIYSDVIRENFDSQGTFIGSDKLLDRNIEKTFSDLIYRLQYDNTSIIISFNINPTDYNKTLQTNLAQGK